MAKNSKFGPMERFLVHFGPFWRGQILVDLAGQQTPSLWCGAPDPPPHWCGHQTTPYGVGTRPPPGAPHQTPPPLDGHKFDPKVSEASVAHRVESHFKNEVNSRFGPPPYFDGPANFILFSLFPKEIHFPIGKKKKSKKKMTSRRRRRRGKKIFFFFFF